MLRTTFLSQVRFPSIAIALVIPGNILTVIDIRAEDRPVIQHRVDQHLKNGIDLPSVMSRLNERRRQTSPGAGTSDRDPFGVDVQLLGVSCHPPQSGVAIIQRGREWIFGSEPIIHGNNGQPQFTDKMRTTAVILLRLPDQIPTTVDPESYRCSCGDRIWFIDS